MKEEKFLNCRKPSHRHVCEEFWNLREHHNPEKNKQTNTQNRGLTTSASREVTQKLTSAASEQAVGRKVRVASSVLKVRTGPECPECPI